MRASTELNIPPSNSDSSDLHSQQENSQEMQRLASAMSQVPRSRLSMVSTHLRAASSVPTPPIPSRPIGREAILEKRPDDVVITFLKRSPMTRAKKGGLAHTPSDELLRNFLAETIKHSRVPPALVQDIAVGTCHPPSPCYEARCAALAAGFPNEVPVQAINRLCSSGLMAIRSIANNIRNGEIEIGLAVGVESMSSNPRPSPRVSEALQPSHEALDSIKPMGWTSELVAQDFNITRQKQDEFALRSVSNASRAQKTGLFAQEILPIQGRIEGGTGTKLVTEDDGIRHGTTAEALAKLKSAFPDWGQGLSTGGNSSQVTDGVASAVLMSRQKAQEMGLDIVGKYVGVSVAGVEPKYMGIGPEAAIPMLLKNTGLSQEEIDLWEINEAFASQYAYCVETLKLPVEKVNVNGGAISLGHPLGCTGVRLVVTGLHELARRPQNERLLVTSMCVGSGMGAAGLFVSEKA